MDIRLLSKKYKVRTLGIHDVDTIYAMCCKNEIFYQYHPPFVTKESIVEDMSALPPNKRSDDKYYIGFFLFYWFSFKHFTNLLKYYLKISSPI